MLLRKVDVDGVVIQFAETDAAWSRLISAKSSYCVLCGSSCVTPAHIISRRYSNTRLAVENGVPLCIMCHRWFDALVGNAYERAAVLLIGARVFAALRSLVQAQSEVPRKWI